MWGWIPGFWNHDLSQSQMFTDQTTQVPPAFFYLIELLNVKPSVVLGSGGMNRKLSSSLGVRSKEC